MKKQILFAAAALSIIGNAALAQTGPVPVTSQAERWLYPFDLQPPPFTNRPNAPIFTFVNDPAAPVQFGFDYWDGTAIVRFNLGPLPVGITAPDFVIDSARLTIWCTPDMTLDPNKTFFLFAAGFGPNYTETGWNIATSPFIGSGPVDPTDVRQRDPFMRDLITDDPADRDPAAEAWAIGNFDTAAMQAGNPFSVVFDLDLTNPTIEAEVRRNINNGIATWIVASNFSGQQQVTGAPRVIFSATTNPPAPATAPMLEITVTATPANVSDWMTF